MIESDLLWHQTQGSGFALTRSDLLDMPVHELLALHEDVGRRREAESDAIENARKRAR